MTATNRNAGVRRDADFYPTPEKSTLSILRALQLPFTAGWLEPCAGDGAIIRATSMHFSNNRKMPEWTAVELHERDRQTSLLGSPADWICPQDFLTWQPKRDFNVAITNPPFSLAMEIIIHAMTMADILVFLLRLDWLGSRKRSAFHKKHPADIYVLSDRPFPDACEYAWFVWGLGGGRWFLLDD